MTALRTGPHGRRLLWAAAFAFAVTASQAVAQQTTIPPGFDSVPRPPGQVGGGQSFMPPGGQSGVLAPTPSPLELAPPSRPVSLPPPQGPTLQASPPTAAAVVPAIPMVPAGQVALMVSARFGREPPNISGALHWRIYPDKPDANGVFRMLREE